MEFSAHLLEFDSLVKDLRRKGFIQEQIADRCFVIKGEKSAFQDSKHDIGLCVLGLIHGNEYGGLGVLNKLLLGILQGTHRPMFPTGIALGNVPAGFEEARFTEKDLNRVFTSTSNSSYEERRAKELEPIITRSRFLIDLHQTIEPTTSPFFILGFQEKSLQFANELDAELPVVTYQVQSRVESGLTVTGLAMHTNGIALSLELGQKGFASQQINFGFSIVEKAIEILNQSHSQIKGAVRRIVEVPIPEDRTVYYFAHKIENLGNQTELSPGFTNFQAVQTGQLLGYIESAPYLSPLEGFVLFPKYGRSKIGTKELCVILQSATIKSYKEQSYKEQTH